MGGQTFGKENEKGKAYLWNKKKYQTCVNFLLHHEFAQIIVVEDEDSQDYIFNHINTPQYQISIFHIILLNIHVAMRRKRQSREIKIFNDGEIKIVKVEQRLSIYWLDIPFCEAIGLKGGF
ncbi:hypothetical protein GQ457_12G023900 [Hibiscus cannabinus]